MISHIKFDLFIGFKLGNINFEQLIILASYRLPVNFHSYNIDAAVTHAVIIRGIYMPARYWRSSASSKKSRGSEISAYLMRYPIIV